MQLAIELVIEGGVVVAVVAGVANLVGYVRVVVIAVYIGADTVAVVIADAGAGGGRAGAVAVGIELVVEGGVVPIVAGVANLAGDVRIVVITVHISADTVAVVIADAGAGGGVQLPLLRCGWRLFGH